MWQLTQEQQTLAAEYFYIAKSTAQRMRYARDPDRSFSASCYGLCYAAHKWKEGFGTKTFRNFAIWSCRKSIQCEFRRDNREKQNTRMDEGKHYPHMAVTNAADWDLEGSYEVESLSDDHPEIKQRAKVSQALSTLAPQERKVMEMTFAGMRQCDIERKMGWSRHVAGAALSRGIAKLKKALSK